MRQWFPFFVAVALTCSNGNIQEPHGRRRGGGGRGHRTGAKTYKFMFFNSKGISLNTKDKIEGCTVQTVPGDDGNPNSEKNNAQPIVNRSPGPRNMYHRASARETTMHTCACIVVASATAMQDGRPGIVCWGYIFVRHRCRCRWRC